MKDHITEQEFLLEFFGSFGRELGDPKQFYTDNPHDMFTFMDECAKEKKPAFVSVQPRNKHNSTRVFGVLGIEKLFFDFDYGHESDELTEGQIEIRKMELESEVVRFITSVIDDWKLQPLVVKSRRGYHVYIFFDRIYEIDRKKNLWNEVYKNLLRQFKNFYETKYQIPMVYFDDNSCDITRLCRIPFSIHQKSGEKCIIVDRNLKPDKIRSISFFKVYGLRRGDLKRAVDVTYKQLAKKEMEKQKRKQMRRVRREEGHGFIGTIRPCFMTRMEAGEMCYPQRLALLLEAYYSNDEYKTVEGLIDLFRTFNDFNDKKTRDQVEWFFTNEIFKRPPYRCDTITEKGWCIKEECPIYQRRIGKYDEQTKEKA